MPTTPRRRSYHHGDLPAALLDAAERLVEEHGVLGFSLREAARAVGVDVAACYRHFDGRGGVLIGVAQRGFAVLGEAFERELAEEKPAAAPEVVLAALGRRYVRFAREQPSKFRVMFGPNGVGARGPVVRGESSSGRTPFEILSAVVARWLGEGARGDQVERASMALWSGVHGVASLLVDGAWRPATLREADDLVDVVIAALISGWPASG